MKVKGLLFLLRVGDGADPETFTTIAGQRMTSATAGVEQINVTDKDDSRWRKLIEGGVLGIEINCKGVIKDADSYELVRDLALTGEIRHYEIVFGNGYTITGPFQIQMLDVQGEYTDAQQYDLTLTGAREMVVDLNEGRPGWLLSATGGQALLLSEGGDQFLLIEAALEPFLPDLGGVELDHDPAPDLSNWTFTQDPVTGEPTRISLEDFAIAAGLRVRVVTTYVTPGVYEWGKPAGARSVRVECTGGGGGGGGGASTTGTSQSGAGAGGGGGACATRTFEPSEVAESVTVTVGSGGVGGASVTSTGPLDGNAATAGANSSFGSLVIGYAGGSGRQGRSGTTTTRGGGGGGGGASAGGDGSDGSAGAAGSFGGAAGGGDSFSAWCGAGGGGAAGTSTGARGGYAVSGAQGGGGGGGGSSAGIAGGLGPIFNSTSVNAGGVGSSGLHSPTKDGASLAGMFALSMRGSGGGGGGNSNSSGANSQSGHGGDGQQPGGGGGGGGCAFGQNGTVTKVSGSGGDGGHGAVRITVEF